MGLQSTLPHKSTHATGGTDELTPADIGAAPLVHGHFQPNPEILSDATSDALFSQDGYGIIKLEKGFYSDNSIFYRGNGIELNKQGLGGTWLLHQNYDDAEGYDIASSTNVTTYPWQATWPAGTSVSKYQLPRVVSPLAATASEGTSTYAARADHVHPFPTAAQVGAAPAGNYVILDGTGKISSTQLPSYVDDVVEYGTLSALQADTTARVSGKIYVTRDTGKIYRWSGYSFIEISNTLELQNLMLPNSTAQILLPAYGGKILSVSGFDQGKNTYFLREGNDYWRVFWTGSMWVASYDYDDSDWQGESPNQKSSSNTQYPWQATSWVDYGFGGGVSRVGTYDASLAPKPLSAEPTSGVGTKAAREDHVHPLPTPAAIGAATSAQGAKADTSLQQGAYISAASLEVGSIAEGQTADLYVGQDGKVGVGTETPTERLTVAGNIDLLEGQIKNLGTPVADTDVATKGYVDNLIPQAPPTGTYALRSVDGVVSWVAA